MASEAGICNIALHMVKNNRRISSLSEDTKEGRACDDLYVELRDSLLSMAKWKFALHRVQLAQDATAPEYEYSYRYRLPPDYFRKIHVAASANSRAQVQYEMESGFILTNSPTIYLRYLRRVEDPNLMTPLFRQALSKLLASRLSSALGGSTTLGTKLYEEFMEDDLPRAKSVDALEDLPANLPESDWVLVRRGGYDDVDPGPPE